jgi:hypothetical protein
MQAVRFIAACEALAESFEQAGRIDLATLCDKAAYWLEGGPRIDHLSLDEVVTACREAIVTEQQSMDDARFCHTLADRIDQSLRSIAARVRNGHASDRIELAARLRAVQVLTEKLF